MFAIVASHETNPEALPLYYQPDLGVSRPWTRNRRKAERYNSKRDAFAAAMFIDAASLAPRGASLEVVAA
jgi:hypothetical protein